MPDAITGVLTGGQLLGSSMEADAAKDASRAQAEASAASIAEQQRQFDAVQSLLRPYVQAGTGAIGEFEPYQQAGQQAFQQQQALAGLLGPYAQQAAISQVESSPFFQSQVRQGEEALLQRASATGGLRGGNVQGALAQFRPQMLQQAIEEQYGRLGGFAGAGLGASEALYRGGQASAAGQASMAQTVGTNISNLLGQQGAARAAGTLGQAEAYSGAVSGLSNIAGQYFGRQSAQPQADPYSSPLRAAMQDF